MKLKRFIVPLLASLALIGGIATSIITALPVLADSANLYAVVGQGTLTDSTGTSNPAVVRLTPAGQTITVTVAGNFTVTMCAGTSAVATSGATAIVTGSPLSCPAATATTVTVVGVGDFTIATTYASTGLWSNGYSWSSTSGGIPNDHAIPASTNSVFFDANSFGGTGETFTVDDTASCLSMDWTGAANTPKLSIGASVNLAIYGNITLIANMTLTAGNAGSCFLWKWTSGVNTLTTNGKSIPFCVQISGVGGTYQLGDYTTITSQNGFILTGGTFNCNGFNLNCSGVSQILLSGSTSARTFNMTGVTVTCYWWYTLPTTNLTLVGDANSVLNTGTTFEGGGLSYPGTVNFTGTVTLTVTGSNTFNNLTILSTSTKTVKFTDGTTQHVSVCSLSGSAGHVHTLQGTSTAGWNLIKDGGGTVTVSYCTITKSVASPANTWYYDGTCTYNSTSGWNTLAVSITNSPTTLDFGIVMPSTTYYAYNQSNAGSYPNPVTSSQCYFTITNAGSSSCNIALSCTNASGGNAWTLVTGTPAGDQFKVTAVYNGENPASGLVLTNANQAFYIGLAASATLLWDFKELLGGTGVGKAGTFSDSAVKTFTVTITGS